MLVITGFIRKIGCYCNTPEVQSTKKRMNGLKRMIHGARIRTNGQSLVNFLLSIQSMYGIFCILTYSLHLPSKINHVGKYTVRPMDPSWVMEMTSIKMDGISVISLPLRP